MFRIVSKKPISAIASEWDALAPIRYEQITSGVDVTYSHVLSPIMLDIAAKQTAATILDAGCGTGVLTAALGTFGGSVVGIDPSAKSIAVAQDHFGGAAEFRVATLEEYARSNRESADLVIANMVLIDVTNLLGFVGAVGQALRQRGAFVFSITHPWFWPSYYGYAGEDWFHYERELIIESPFRISAREDCALQSTHVHRPLGMYLQAFSSVGLTLQELREPMPSPAVEAKYPRPWRVPRYLIGLCRR
jgi:SAM-dependent methyltransferase